jgi:SAM-dependent methyltransferase
MEMHAARIVTRIAYRYKSEAHGFTAKGSQQHFPAKPRRKKPLSEMRGEHRLPSTWSTFLHSPDAHPPMVPYRGSSVAPIVVVTPNTSEFRRLCKGQLVEHDRVIEIGCSYGQASQLLLGGASYLGVDISYECISHCLQFMPSARFVRLDVMSDQDGFRAALNAESPTLVALDIGGVRNMPDVIFVIDSVLSALAAHGRDEAELASLAKGPVASSLLILVKSEQLAEDIETHCVEATPSNAPLAPCAIPCPDGWWAAAREQCQQRKNGGKGLGLDVKLRVPTWYPQRAANPGAPFICRYHNYALDGCKKTVRCPFDHDHCHFCFLPGHIARDCEGFNLTLQANTSTSDLPEGDARSIT